MAKTTEIPKLIKMGCLVGVLFLSACRLSPESLLEKGDTLRAQGKSEEALKIYQKIINFATDHPSSGRIATQAYLHSGHIYFYNLGDYNTALNIYLDIAKNSPKSSERFEAKRLAASILDEHLHNQREAIDLYEEIIREFRATDDVMPFMMALADAYFTLNDFEQARIEYKNLLQQGPEPLLKERALFQIADYYMENRCVEALKTYEDVVSQFPESQGYTPRARFGMANCQEERGDYPLAIKTYETLLKTYPNPEVIQIKLANLKMRLKNIPEKTAPEGAAPQISE